MDRGAACRGGLTGGPGSQVLPFFEKPAAAAAIADAAAAGGVVAASAPVLPAADANRFLSAPSRGG